MNKFEPLTTSIDSQRILWYEILDILTGCNPKRKDHNEAIQMARKCTWHEAIWFLNVISFVNNDTEYTKDNIRYIFQNEALKSKNGIALMIVGGRPVDHTIHYTDYDNLIAKVAEAGDQYAQCMMSDKCSAREMKFYWAMLSAKEDNPWGLHRVGHCYYYGVGVEVNRDLAAKCWKRSAELGYRESMRSYGFNTFLNDHPSFYFWLGKYARNTCFDDFHKKNILMIIEGYKRSIRNNNDLGVKYGPLMYEIGKSLIGQIDCEAHTVFGEMLSFNNYCDLALALHLYEKMNRLTRESVDLWSLIGLRYNVVKDIRKVISNFIWESRSEGLYLLK